MPLVEFVAEHTESILTEWEAIAEATWPESLGDANVNSSRWRDHAEVILRGIHAQLMSPAAETPASGDDFGSNSRATDDIPFEEKTLALATTHSALRAAVLRLWRERNEGSALDELARFDEAVDRSLSSALATAASTATHQRQELVASQQRARKEADKASHAKDMLLATLSHEMRTQLNSIVGWLEVLRMKEDLDDELTEGLDVIDRNAKAQVLLIDDMLDVSRILSGKFHLETSECNLVETITAAIDTLRPAAMARDITLRVELDPNASHAVADATRVQQVVTNLLSNAIKFTRAGGVVRVELVRESDGFRLAVRDNGQGISPELLPHVFERFQLGEQAPRRQYSGSGLGLSIVKHLTEMHGGTVEAQSDGEGKGSTFTVFLPEEPAPRELPESPRPPAIVPADSGGDDSSPVRLDGLRVMMIDDDIHSRTVHGRLLKRYGAQVTSAGSVAEALAGLVLATKRGEAPDVLVSDIGMPDLDGYELIREVRRRGFDSTQLPAIALTAHVSHHDAHEAAQAGYQVHLKKPVAIGELTATIARLAGQVDGAAVLNEA